jgi:DNA-binding MarR family transcriptional regulator
MSLEQQAKILKTATQTPIGIRDLAHTLNMKTANAIALVNKMEQEQLIKTHSQTTNKKGRPKKLVTPTELGTEFLRTYQQLTLKPLRATKADLDHAVRDAQYAKRLVERGKDPFEVFMELNMIASNISKSSPTRQPVRRKPC